MDLDTAGVAAELGASGVIRVAAGKTAPYTDSIGNVWAADTAFTGGTALVSSPVPPISGTADPSLYASERYGTFQYTFAVPNGSYAVNLKFAESYVTAAGQRKFDVAINGAPALTSFDIFAKAGGRFLPIDEQFTVAVTGGTITIEFSPGAIQSPKVDAIEVRSAAAAYAAAAPFLKLPAQVPGRIEAVDFDWGGEGSGYHDASTTNQGGYYRTHEAVGITLADDVGSDYAVGWIAPGDWMDYTVHVSHAGSYALALRVASAVSTGAFHVDLDNKPITNTVKVPDTGAASPATWTTVSAIVSLPAGVHVLRFVAEANWLDLASIEISPSVTPAQLPPGVGIPLPESFFGLTESSLGNGHDPTVPFGVMRLWDTEAGGWYKSQPTSAAPDFTELDAWVARAHATGAEVMWTAGRMPGWVSTPAPCTGVFAPHGCAQPPNDIDSGDTHWKTFVTALVKHSLTLTPHIKHYECVNEFDLSSEWTGSIEQLVTFCGDMAKIVHSLDPSAVVWGPSASTGNVYGVHGYTSFEGGPGFIAAGGAATFDVMNLHAYIQGCTGVWCDTPEGTGGASGGLLAYLKNARALAGGKPIGFSEGSWGCGNGNTIADDKKVAYLGREYIYLYDAGVVSYVWYAWDNNGNPMTSACGTLAPNDVIGPAGTAYATIQKWLVGSTHVVDSCVHPGTTWTCDITRKGGIHATLIFDPATPTTVSLTGARAAYTTQLHLDGTSRAISGHAVTADKAPILVQ